MSDLRDEAERLRLLNEHDQEDQRRRFSNLPPEAQALRAAALLRVMARFLRRTAVDDAEFQHFPDIRDELLKMANQIMSMSMGLDKE